MVSFAGTDKIGGDRCGKKSREFFVNLLDFRCLLNIQVKVAGFVNLDFK
jgi:hypothetical protein